MFRKPVYGLEWGQAQEDRFVHASMKAAGLVLTDEIVHADARAEKYLEQFHDDNPPITIGQVMRYIGSCLLLSILGLWLMYVLVALMLQGLLSIAHS